MTGCTERCHWETNSQDPGISPGIVEDDERLCRGAFDPRHMKKSKVAANFIPRSHLVLGKLSVYRLSSKATFRAPDVVEELKSISPENNSLSKVLGPEVREIRAIRVNGINGRIFCVRDECDTDDQGGKHRAHAHIAMCELAFPAPVDQSSDAFMQAYADLSTLFRSNEIT